MKKIIEVMLLLSLSAVVMAGCGEDEKEAVATVPAPQTQQIEVVKEEPGDEGPGFSESWDDNASGDVGEIGGISEETIGEGSEEAKEDAGEGSEDASGEKKEEAAEEKEEAQENSNAQPIVWLGDSLTQGSLGHEDDNLANAPYEKLKKKVSVPVEGYGFYGYNTHDIFWVYTDGAHLNQQVDPHKTYVLWVGSCDWCPDEGPNANTAPVMDEIDRFLASGNVKNYIIIGTTSRWRLGDYYIPINNDLAAHYGKHYMDVIDIINKYGYSSDNTHLSQATYDAVANAVYEKLKALGYI